MKHVSKASANINPTLRDKFYMNVNCKHDQFNRENIYANLLVDIFIDYDCIF